MKIVFSQWSLDKEPFKEMLACSNYFAQKHGYETILYTDKKGSEDLKNIQFSEVRLFSDIINKLPKTLWTLGKLLAMSSMNEPFFHIDQDLFLYNDVLKPLCNKDFVVFHDELFVYSHTDLYDIRDRLQVKPKELDSDYCPDSFNFAIVGGQEYLQLKTAASSVIECCIKNKEVLEKFETKSAYISTAVIAEQVWTPSILRTKDIHPYCILQGDIFSTSRELGVQHFWTDKKHTHKKYILKVAHELGVTY